jgi:hypothetical protein
MKGLTHFIKEFKARLNISLDGLREIRKGELVQVGTEFAQRIWLRHVIRLKNLEFYVSLDLRISRLVFSLTFNHRESRQNCDCSIFKKLNIIFNAYVSLTLLLFTNYHTVTSKFHMIVIRMLPVITLTIKKYQYSTTELGTN